MREECDRCRSGREYEVSVCPWCGWCVGSLCGGGGGGGDELVQGIFKWIYLSVSLCYYVLVFKERERNRERKSWQ